jgi:PTH1 family peptidyl-tRNA hydrolase
MNLSGKAVQYWMDKENIPLENYHITDDLNFPLERFASNQKEVRSQRLKKHQSSLKYQYTDFDLESVMSSKGKQVDYV